MREVGLLLRDRELLAPPRRPRGGRASVDAHRLLPDRLPPRRRREPHLDPAGPRHVQERPDPQGDPRRLRVPPAIGPRQPPAHVRGVRGPHEPGGLHERDARPVRDRARRTGRGAVHPADRRRRSRDCRAPDGRPDRRPDRRDPRHRRARGAGARDDAHEEDGRGPRRLPRRARDQGPVAPLGSRHPGARRDPPRPAPRRLRRRSSGSTSFAKGSTCRR